MRAARTNCVVAERDRSSGCVTFHARRLARAASSESKYEELLAIANNRRCNARGISRSQDYAILALIRVAGLRGVRIAWAIPLDRGRRFREHHIGQRCCSVERPLSPVPVIQIGNNRARQKATTARPLTVHTAAIGLGLTPLNLIVWAKTNTGMGRL